jgi:hypothetical protein
LPATSTADAPDAHGHVPFEARPSTERLDRVAPAARTERASTARTDPSFGSPQALGSGVRRSLVLLACCAGSPAGHPAGPPIFDHAIVLGHRVGPVSLGMTEAQLVEGLGPPTSVHGEGGNRTRYDYGKLQLHVAVDTGRVVFVAPDDPSYATGDGIHLGAAEAVLGTHAGELAWRRDRHTAISYCYADRTLVTVADGQLHEIALGGCNP